MKERHFENFPLHDSGEPHFDAQARRGAEPVLPLEQQEGEVPTVVSEKKRFALPLVLRSSSKNLPFVALFVFSVVAGVFAALMIDRFTGAESMPAAVAEGFDAPESEYRRTEIQTEENPSRGRKREARGRETSPGYFMDYREDRKKDGDKKFEKEREKDLKEQEKRLEEARKEAEKNIERARKDWEKMFKGDGGKDDKKRDKDKRVDNR